MKTIVFFLEEPSAKEMLKILAPQIFSEEDYLRFIVFQGKRDLENSLRFKVVNWKTPNTYFVVMRDQDLEDCVTVKQRLLEMCYTIDKHRLIIRIACTELESYYIGDLQAIEKAFKIAGLSKKKNKKKFRAPDDISKPSEFLKRITNGRYQKLSGSRAIAEHMLLSVNNSKSFQALIDGLERIARN